MIIVNKILIFLNNLINQNFKSLNKSLIIKIFINISKLQPLFKLPLEAILLENGLDNFLEMK